MSADLRSMRIEPGQDSDHGNGSLLVDSRPEFPPGLEITLRNEELKKLGFGEGGRPLPHVEERMLLVAMVEVVGIDQDDLTDGSRRRRVRLQLQEMKLEEKPAIKRQAAETLFGPQHR